VLRCLKVVRAHPSDSTISPIWRVSGDIGELWRERISRKARENRVYFIGANCVNTVVAGSDWHGLPYVGQSVIAGPDGRLLKVGSKDREEILVADLIF